jgi:hypothetical protein
MATDIYFPRPITCLMLDKTIGIFIPRVRVDCSIKYLPAVHTVQLHNTIADLPNQYRESIYKHLHKNFKANDINFKVLN